MIYYWCAGQDDNLGDVVLRRRMLRDLQQLGRCCVYIGRASSGFEQSLGLRDTDFVYRNFGRFVLDAALSSFAADWLMCFNPGEITINPKQSLMHAMVIPALLLGRIRGSQRIVRIGVGVAAPTPKSRWKYAFDATVRLSGCNIWRDDTSRDVFGRGTVAPDWAFAAGTLNAPTERRFMGLCLRSDGPDPSDEWIAAIEQVADERHLTPLLLVQVARDEARAQALAKRLNCECVGWGDRSHLEQESALTAAYGKSEVVISDRLHGLILAVANGAVPVGLMEHPDIKIGRHFDSAGFGPISIDATGWSATAMATKIQEIISTELDISAALSEARAKVLELRKVLQSAYEAPRRRSMHYTVGGVRISLDSPSNTPGPRSHILNFLEGAKQCGIDARLFLVSDFPFLARFKDVKQSDYKAISQRKMLAVDLVRLVIMAYSGLVYFIQTATSPPPKFIYERVAIFQSLSAFHARKRRTVRVVEANGILSRETARDRKILKLTKLAARVERRTLRGADIVVCVSNPLAAEIQHFAGVDPARLLVVPNGLDVGLLTIPRRNRPGIYTIGFVGSIVKWHQLDSIIAAVGEYAESTRDPALPDIRMELIGEGPEVPLLQEIVARNGWGDRIVFLGKMRQPDAFQAMAAWDAGVAGHRKSSSATMYHSPLKLYEYAAMGLDIICTPSDDADALSKSGALVRTFHRMDEFAAMLRSSVQQHRSAAEVEESRRAVATDHSWESRVQLVLDAVEAESRGHTVE